MTMGEGRRQLDGMTIASDNGVCVRENKSGTKGVKMKQKEWEQKTPITDYILGLVCGSQ